MHNGQFSGSLKSARDPVPISRGAGLSYGCKPFVGAESPAFLIPWPAAANQPPSLSEPSPGLARCRPSSKLRGEAMIDNRTQVFDVAMKNARTIEACVDRLTMMGADHELKLIARRLGRLSRRTAPSEEAMRPTKEEPRRSLPGSKAPRFGVNDAAAIWRTCRSIILAGWAALGCDVWATGSRKRLIASRLC
jgi:hypothetical protein